MLHAKAERDDLAFGEGDGGGGFARGAAEAQPSSSGTVPSGA